MRKGATFSKGDDRRHRYALWRIWDDELPLVNFIGINPSTATHRDDDPTLRRCADFARRWGFGGVVMTNLFSFRHPNRNVMRRQPDRVGPRTNLHLVQWARRAGRVVAAWGADRICAEREGTVLGLLADMDIWCLRLTAGERPEHPLYVPAATQPRIYRPR